jgi:uncharacterized protein (TIGR02271 family)
MTSMTSDQAASLAGGNGNVLDNDGDKIGSIGQIYLDDSTGQPSWVTVKTGLFGTSESFVPLDNARVNGNDIVVAFEKETVKGAPRIDADNSLSPAEEDDLYTYYKVGNTNTTAGFADVDTDRRTADVDTDRRVTDVDTDRNYESDRDTVGHDTSGPTTDDAMTRSEERLNVGTQTRETGRARLRKYVVTENVTQTVPVSREEVRIEREPITDANVGDATSGPAISEEEHEVTLHSEVPVVEKDVVPVERVRLDKETVTEQETVSDEVRKEQVDVDTDNDGGVRR